MLSLRSPAKGPLPRKPPGGASRRLLMPLRKLGRTIVAWANACAEYRAAAFLYEQLNRLSDAELKRRGLSRAALAREAIGRAGWRMDAARRRKTVRPGAAPADRPSQPRTSAAGPR
jgi:hypothetical protein